MFLEILRWKESLKNFSNLQSKFGTGWKKGDQVIKEIGKDIGLIGI